LILSLGFSIERLIFFSLHAGILILLQLERLQLDLTASKIKK
jgi:hypothetical protein